MRHFKTSGDKARGIRTKAAGVAALIGATLVTVQARAEDLLGQPTPGGIGLQPAASSLRHQAIFFHDAILMPIITVISLFVLALLGWVVIRFNKRRNPEPARWSHNTPIEVAWTVAPVLILAFIAIFSFRLLFAYHDVPRADLTIKATGNQWYWNYEYPDQKAGGSPVAFDSIILPEDKAKARHVPYKLAVDNPLVVPVNANVKVLTTGADVIHAFFVPAFGVQTDAVPGRINEQWFRAERTGVYYGQCNELCGVDHAFMPIEVDVVDQGKWRAWVAEHERTGSKAAPAGSPAAAPPVKPSALPKKTVALAPSPARG